MRSHTTRTNRADLHELGSPCCAGHSAASRIHLEDELTEHMGHAERKGQEPDLESVSEWDTDDATTRAAARNLRRRNLADRLAAK